MFSLSGRPSRNDPVSSSQSLGEMNYTGVGLIQIAFLFFSFPKGMMLVLVKQLGLVHAGEQQVSCEIYFAKAVIWIGQCATHTNFVAIASPTVGMKIDFL